LDKQVEERFANRRRARIGMGYRLNYKHRFDLAFTLQASRNEIDEEFTGTDNVIQLKYKMFLNPAKPTKVIGDGTHERVVVNVAKFDERVQRKLK
jgi:hypothetical protein